MAARAGAARTVHRPLRGGPPDGAQGRRSAGVAAPGLAGLLAACGGGSSTGSPSAGGEIPAPDNPVRWPLSGANPAIESGLTPERGSTLRIYNYADYLSPRLIKDFEDEYGVNIRLSTFNDADEALTKIASEGPRLRPLLPELRLRSGSWSGPTCCGRSTTTTSPTPATCGRSCATRGTTAARATPIPYTIYSTGIGWRTDMVDEDVAALHNPYDVLWDTEYAGNMAILDDWHTAMAMVLLRNGIYDINTTDPKDIALVRDQLLDMRHTMQPAGHDRACTPSCRPGSTGCARCGPGDAINLPYYLPDKTSTGRAALLVPRGRPGRGRQRPVRVPGPGQEPGGRALLHQRPARRQGGRDELRLHRLPAAAGAVHPGQAGRRRATCPKNLATAIVQQRTSTSGVPLLQLPAAADAAWHQVWQEFKAGG